MSPLIANDPAFQKNMATKYIADSNATPMTAEAAVMYRWERGRCDDCGRFCRVFYDVWVTQPYPSIDREVCRRCAIALGIEVTDERA